MNLKTAFKENYSPSLYKLRIFSQTLKRMFLKKLFSESLQVKGSPSFVGSFFRFKSLVPRNGAFKMTRQVLADSGVSFCFKLTSFIACPASTALRIAMIWCSLNLLFRIEASSRHTRAETSCFQLPGFKGDLRRIAFSESSLLSPDRGLKYFCAI